MNTYASPLVEKENKDEYAASGYLEVDDRMQLLSEWAPGSRGTTSLRAQLERATPEIERLQRELQQPRKATRVELAPQLLCLLLAPVCIRPKTMI